MINRSRRTNGSFIWPCVVNAESCSIFYVWRYSQIYTTNYCNLMKTNGSTPNEKCLRIEKQSKNGHRHAFSKESQSNRHHFTFSRHFPDASSSNEAVHLQQRLKSLSSELVTLRNRLHVDQTNVDVPLNGDAAPATAAVAAAAAAAALNLVTTAQQAPPASAAVAAAAAAHLTNGPFVTNHTSMQMGSSTILPVAKANPKVGAPTHAPNRNLCAPPHSQSHTRCI